jgi:predicted DCC family thiol-disulfide oxidoreductase YuxK
MLPNNILKIFLIGKILPKIFNDFIYNVVSKVRYKLYGKKEKCDIPSTSTRDRFLL